MAKTAAIVQSNYLPWRGYFDLIRHCDLFVISDSLQYTKRDWRNRNIVKTPSGPLWLTVPVRHGAGELFAIDEAVVAKPRWVSKHVKTLSQCYRRGAGFDEVAPWLFPLLESLEGEQYLSRINERLLIEIAARLGITTPIVQATEFLPRETMNNLEKNVRTLEICQAAGVTRYLSGPAAKVYLDEEFFRSHGVEVAWMSYEGYPEYRQLWGGFEPRVSIVDLLLNTGAAASSYFPSIAEAGCDEPDCGSGQSRDGKRAMVADTAPGK